MSYLAESHIEQAALEILENLGYDTLFGPDIAPDGKLPERVSYSEVILKERLLRAVARLNPSIPKEAQEEAVKKVLRIDSPNLIENNKEFHKYFTEGIEIEYRKDDRIKSDIIKLVDFNNPEKNDFLAVNQFTVIEGEHNRRPDIVIFINGLPIAVIELKNPADEKATIWSAFGQLQTYKQEIPSLFKFNEILVISDGTEARAGSLTSNREWFMAWKTVDGENIAPSNEPQLKVLLYGIFNKERFLDIVNNFIVFEDNGKNTSKIIAAYHQYYTTNKAVLSTVNAIDGDKRIGIVWHTQGSGKSLTMVFYSRKLALNKKLENPTIVVITDRNDLDDQLFDKFSSCKDLLRQTPVQANSREELKEYLKVASGGIVFTTIQKFFPENKGERYETLSYRKNIIVIADEAHRSQYDFIDGFARHMRDALPNASFIGFTGTPIELSDRSTRNVFGDYIDVYDIEQAVEDGATVRIYYESRLAKLNLDEEERPKIDVEFEMVTEDEEALKKEKLKSKWARLEAVVGSEKRIDLIARDIIDHFEKREESLKGKAMIVCMSRRICVEMYNAMAKYRPEWVSDDDSKGIIKVVMTGGPEDPIEWQKHIRNKIKRKELANRFRDPNDDFKIAIVRDMWLTGFDVPCLHTMYFDKPMRGHGLMQAIARVNRVFKDKPGGLVVDYLGLAYELKEALATYTESGGKGKPVLDQEEAVRVMKEKYEIVSSMFYGFDYQKFFSGSPQEKMDIIPKAMEHIFSSKDGKERFLKYVSELSRAFSLAVPHDEALKIRDDVIFFQGVRAAISKLTPLSGKSDEELDTAIKQIVSKAVSSSEVIDVLEVLGIKQPEVSILSDEFLEEVRGMEQKNLAVEALSKLLSDEIKVRFKNNIVRSRSFSQMLEETIKKYHNRAIETAEVIVELINLAKDVREAQKRGDKLKLSEEELAFYDALSNNESAVKVLGDETLKNIARELTEIIRKNTTIDWTIRESVKANLRVMVKRLLRKYNYPPDKQEEATKLVLEQAALLSESYIGE
ncbi:MAG: type I restriction endonuclease subunit R [archaeon]